MNSTARRDVEVWSALGTGMSRVQLDNSETYLDFSYSFFFCSMTFSVEHVVHRLLWKDFKKNSYKYDTPTIWLIQFSFVYIFYFPSVNWNLNPIAFENWDVNVTKEYGGYKYKFVATKMSIFFLFCFKIVSLLIIQKFPK